MLSVVVLLIVFIGALLLSNSVFLERYYIYQTREAFQNAYDSVYKAYHDYPDDLLYLIRSLNSENGYKYILVDRSNAVILSSAPEFKENSRLELPRYQREYIDHNRKALNKGEILYGPLVDENKGQSFVQHIGKLKKDEYLVISQPLAQLSENARIANSFFLMIGVAMLSVSVLVTYFMSKRLVRPILDITFIAQRIADLDFTLRYQGNSEDEVGILGESINTISKKLDSTISDLKLTNEQLNKEMQLQKRFLASVSHEFKTPVGLIRGYGETLEHGMVNSPTEQKEISGIIIKEADRLNRLVNDIILLMRMESGAFKMKMQKIDLVPIMQETLDKFSMIASKKQVKLTKDIPESLPVFVDGERIIQVLDNLFSNSLRHVNNKGEIKFEAIIIHDIIRIELMNTGTKIPENHLGHLFEPFYRVEESRSRKSGGSGLGLSIVKGIITAHKGDCGVKNIDNGVIFWFTLPISKDNDIS